MKSSYNQRNYESIASEENKSSGVIGYFKNLTQTIGNYLFKHEDDGLEEEGKLFIEILGKNEFSEKKIVDNTLKNTDTKKNSNEIIKSLNVEEKKLSKLSKNNIDNISLNPNISLNKRLNSVQKIVDYIKSTQ